jgi:hypothetical protein
MPNLTLPEPKFICSLCHFAYPVVNMIQVKIIILALPSSIGSTSITYLQHENQTKCNPFSSLEPCSLMNFKNYRPRDHSALYSLIAALYVAW